MTNQNFKWSVVELSDLLKQTAELDKDNLIAMDGPTGVGKSTLGVKLCRKACPWFDMNRDIIYSRDEIMQWIATAQPGSWGLADEAVNALFKRDFAAKGQKFLLKILDMCRSRNLTIILCIPNFWALDSHILQGRIRLRIHVNSTGHAFLWKPSGNPFEADRWFRKYNQKVCWGWDRSMASAVRTKGYMGEVDFGDLTSEIKAEYVKIKEEKKRMIAEQEDKQGTKEEAEVKEIVEFAKYELLYWLDNRGKLTDGWIKALALIERIEYETAKSKVRRFRKKYEENGTDMKLAIQGAILEVPRKDKYNNTNNNDNLDNPSSSDTIQHNGHQAKEEEPEEVESPG